MILRDSPPKKPLTAYFLFLGEERLNIVKENPRSSIQEISQIAGQKWRELPYEKKQQYIMKQQELKKQYEQQRIEYEKKHGKIKKKQKPQELEQYPIKKKYK